MPFQQGPQPPLIRLIERAKRSYTTSKKIQHRDGVAGDTKYGARLSRTTSTLRGIR
jgi:hypothetical protein